MVTKIKHGTSPFLTWMAHRLRLVGQVSAEQAKRAFGIDARQFRRGVESYNSHALQRGQPEVEPVRLEWGSGTANPTFRVAPKEGSPTDREYAAARESGDVFPMASGLIPTTAEALGLLDAWRAHGILARVAPEVYGDPTFMDSRQQPLVEEVGLPTHPRLDGEVIPVLLQAITLRKSVSMDYIDKRGKRKNRQFSPQRFIFAQGRYHVRGYDLSTAKHLDLNPARAFSIALLQDAAYWGPEEDEEWQKTVHLRFQVLPQVRKNENYWGTIRQTFPVNDAGSFKIQVRKPMAYYARLQVLGYTLRGPDQEIFAAFGEIPV